MTMKLFFYAIMSEAIIPQGFLDIEKTKVAIPMVS